MVEEYINAFRCLSKIATPVKVHSRKSGHHIEIMSQWEQRDLQRSEKVKYQRSHFLTYPGLKKLVSTLPVELNKEQLRAYSSDGKFAVLRKVSGLHDEKEKQYIEIWTENGVKVKAIDVSVQEKHLQILSESQFGCLEWSPCSQHLLYVAERFHKADSYFKADTPSKQGSDSTKHETKKGDEFAYRQSWGESLQKVHHPLVFILNVETEEIEVPEITFDVSCGQATWTPDGKGFVFVGWWNQPFRLGLIYCGNRRSALFHLDLQSKKTSIIEIPENRSVEFPHFSPDGRNLIFLSSTAGGPHRNVQSLMKCEWLSKKLSTVVDDVGAPTGPSLFPGIYTLSLPRRLWAKDCEHIILHSIWRSKQELLCINVSSGKVDRLTNDAHLGNWEVLDCFEDIIVAAVSAPNFKPHLMVGQFTDASKAIIWVKLDDDGGEILPIEWEILDIMPTLDAKNPKYPNVDYDAVFAMPSSKHSSAPFPLVVLPHGGPHATFCASYLLSVEFFTKFGLAVLLVNYRGSLGFGQDSINSLVGNVGSQDVADVQYAVESVLKSGKVDRHRMVLYGGSHGGFLSLSISGLFPDMYKACVVRNPVVDLTGLLSLSDIPDWCFVENGSFYDFSTLTDISTLESMWQKSPIRLANKIKIPVLFLLGSLDLRVPHQQGLWMHKALKARNVDTSVYMYEDNHALQQVASESDSLIHTIEWMSRNIALK